MLYFNYAQTFWLDKSAVKNAAEVALTRVDLYFRAKPPATNNKSGIENPGVEVKIVPCLNGIPVINQMGAYRPTEPTEHGAKFAFYSGGETARVEYDQIIPSTNANIPTTFLFNNPILVATDKEYAVIVKFDGNENYVLWTNETGETLVGTNQPSSGPTGKYTGTLFEFIDDPNKQNSLIESSTYGYSNTIIGSDVADSSAIIYSANVVTFDGVDTKYLQANWTSIPNEDLKFKVYVGRYFVNGVSVAILDDYISNSQITSTLDRPSLFHDADAVLSNNMIRLTAPVQPNEYLIFEAKNSARDDLNYGEPFYQVGPAYPGGTATPLTVTCAPSVAGANEEYTAKLIQANGSYVFANGSTFNDEGGFNSVLSLGDFFIVQSGNTPFICTVEDINSNTELVVTPSFDETLSNAQIYIAPIGFLNDISRNNVFGSLSDLATLYNTTANSTVRFTSHSIANATIAANGTGYSNNDYIRIDGYEDIDYAVKGNYSAYANIVTNANGSITNVYFSNTGAGFTNSEYLVGANVSILKSTGGVASNDASDGTSANIIFTVSSLVKSVFKSTQFANVEVVNIESIRMKPEITVNNPVGASFLIKHRTLYYMVKDANTHSGKAYYVNTPEEAATTDTFSKIFKSHTLKTSGEGRTPVLTSRSNEYVIRFANGEVNDANTFGEVYSNTACFIFDISSNNDYQAIFLDPEIVNSHYGKYIINDNYTGEHTNYGSAYAKHIATKINLAEDHLSEDVLVYLTAYRPANTDLKVYARLHNSKDPTAFDDLDWTLLELIDGTNVYSSSDNSSDYREYTYNLPAYPNTDFTVEGSVELTQGNVHVVGTNTVFGARTLINDGGTGYTNGDIVSFTSPNTAYVDTYVYAYKRSVNAQYTVTTDASGVITALTAVNTGIGWANQSAVSTFTVANSTGGDSGGSTANLYFYPGLAANDMVKIYSPYVEFANQTYTIAIVDEVVSNTDFTVKKTFGTVEANSAGNVSINTTSTTLVGTGTDFTQLSANDFIIVWANSSVYETKRVVSIANTTQLTMDSNGTFTNTATKYAYVTPDAFINNSISLAGLLVDKIAYPHQAFNNIQNDNVARYYSTTLVEYDSYDTMQLKIVLLSDNDVKVPKVDDHRGMLVSA